METKSQLDSRYSDLALYRLEAGDSEAVSSQASFSQALPAGITDGMLLRDIAKIAWPSLVELALTQVTSMIDLMMVGSLGAWALTAVGLTTQPKQILSVLFIAFNVGTTAMVARYKGNGEQEKANTVLRQAIMFTTLLALVMSAIGFVFARQFLLLMRAAEPAVVDGGAVYFKILMLGFPAFALTTALTATLRGVGRSNVTMMYNTVSNVIKLGLNLLLIKGNLGFPAFGVSGASIATVAGQLAALGIALYQVLNGRNYLKIKLTDRFAPVKAELKKIFKIGLPSMFGNVAFQIGMTFYSVTVSGLGTIAFATHQACISVLQFSVMIGSAIAVSSTTLVGQSLGRRRPDMAQLYSSRSSQLGLCLAIVFGSMLFFFGGDVVKLYSSEPGVISNGIVVLKYVAFLQPFQAVQFVLNGSLQGAGDTKITAAVITFTSLIVRPFLAYTAVTLLHWGLQGAWLALIGDQFLRFVLIYIRYRSGKWKLLKI